MNVSLSHTERRRQLRNRSIYGARRCAIATAHLLIRVVAEFRPKDADELLQRVRSVGRRLTASCPKELVLGNIVRRALGLVREASEEGIEIDSAKSTKSTKSATNGDLTSGSSTYVPDNGTSDAGVAHLSSKKSISNVKEDVLDGMKELLDELEQADKQIAEYATDHIYPEEVLLTSGSSLTVQKFLLDAGKRRKFTVFHAEGYPNEHLETHETLLKGAKRNLDDLPGEEVRLKSLAAAGINVICIPDSAIFIVLPKVHKVIISAQAILSNGGCVAPAGTSLLAMAAKLHRKPMIVLGAIYRLSPTFPFDPSSLIDHGDPGKIVNYSNGDVVEDIEIVNATSDYLNPDSTDLIITNM